MSPSLTKRLLLHEGDLPVGTAFSELVAVDTETTGLEIMTRDRLCLVQLCDDSGVCHLVRIAAGQREAPRLRELFEDEDRLKIFHYARFDLAILQQGLSIKTAPVYCTKIASKIARSYSGAHGLKDLCRELLEVDLSKKQQSSDWGRERLSEAQKHYAASDVAYLLAIKKKLDAILVREERVALAQQCFDALPARVQLDLAGWREQDIFAH